MGVFLVCGDESVLSYEECLMRGLEKNKRGLVMRRGFGGECWEKV